MTRAHDSLRPAAIQRDAESASSFELEKLWEQVRCGAWHFVDTFASDERYLGLLCGSRAVPAVPLPDRKAALLERVLLGTPPKVVALESQRSLSSITAAIQDCLRSMGLPTKASQISVLLTMAVRAHYRPESAPQLGRLSKLHVDGETYFVVSVLRPDLQFPVPLSLAEAEVVRSLIAGQSHAQISGARATSPRTVANQLATAFRKLGVSGRRATIERLILHSAQLQ
jgi:DNA-binding NarL/FixJ family response regulator